MLLERLESILNRNIADCIHLEQVYPTSRLVRRISGIGMAPQKPIVGDNAFVFETLEPQLSDSTDAPPYEIMNPEQLGIYTTGYRLTPSATWEQFQQRIKELGYNLGSEDLRECYQAFQELAAKKELVFDADLELLVNEHAFRDQARYKLQYLNVTAGSISVPNATVQLEVDGQVTQDAGFGPGPVDATFKTIYKMVKRAPKLIRYEVNAVTSGTDALGEVVVRLEEGSRQANGRGIDTDIVLASARALINGLNKLEYSSKQAVTGSPACWRRRARTDRSPPGAPPPPVQPAGTSSWCACPGSAHRRSGRASPRRSAPAVGPDPAPLIELPPRCRCRLASCRSLSAAGGAGCVVVQLAGRTRPPTFPRKRSPPPACAAPAVSADPNPDAVEPTRSRRSGAPGLLGSSKTNH